MRLCRFTSPAGKPQLGFYDEQQITPLDTAAAAYKAATGESLDLPASDNPLDFLPPAGPGFAAASRLARWVDAQRSQAGGAHLAALGALPTAEVELCLPLPLPNKLILLAGNYNKHIVERGGQATERAETFPYLFMKPPSTTLTAPGQPVVVPSASPAAIDWELELAVVIGRRCKAVSEAEALSVVAGYTIVNDISNRAYRPNPERKPRKKDEFFDWLHGKWHDSFCPLGPCITSADAIADPQNLKLQLRLNDQIWQDATTAQQIFPVAAIIEFVSRLVTLEPGDIISTGTPDGVGSATGTYLQPGDHLEASIEGIGTLVSPVVAEVAVAAGSTGTTGPTVAAQR